MAQNTASTPQAALSKEILHAQETANTSLASRLCVLVHRVCLLSIRVRSHVARAVYSPCLSSLESKACAISLTSVRLLMRARRHAVPCHILRAGSTP
jgi:hypothetical protein